MRPDAGAEVWLSGFGYGDSPTSLVGAPPAAGVWLSGLLDFDAETVGTRRLAVAIT